MRFGSNLNMPSELKTKKIIIVDEMKNKKGNHQKIWSKLPVQQILGDKNNQEQKHDPFVNFGVLNPNMNFVFAYQVSVFLKDAFEIFHNFSQIALVFCSKCTI